MKRAVTLSLVSFLAWGPPLLAQQKDPKPAEKKSGAEDRESPQDTERKRLRKRIQDAIRRARRGAVVKPAPVKPAKPDAVREALVEVQRAVSRAQGEADLKAMAEELDKAEKALMRARQELWKKLRAQQTERKGTGGSKSKPASRPASGEPSKRGGAGR